MDSFIKIRVCTLVTWAAWITGTALVLLEECGICGLGRLGVLLALYGAVLFAHGWFKTLRTRELVAFDHGRQFERTAGAGVVPLDAHR